MKKRPEQPGGPELSSPLRVGGGEEDDCIPDFLRINQQAGTLYSELNQPHKILSKIEGKVESLQNVLSDIASHALIIQVKS